jgi:hypothetical protein
MSFQKWLKSCLGLSGITLGGLLNPQTAWSQDGWVKRGTSPPLILPETKLVHQETNSEQLLVPPKEVPPGLQEETVTSTTPSPSECEECPDSRFNFKKVPPTRVFPRLGHSPNLPKGPGYYSFLDVLQGNYRENPPKYPYPMSAFMPPSFFDANFRYLDDPKNTETDFFDPFKRVRIGDDWLFSNGGTVWLRYMNETNSRLTQRDNIYELFRFRTYGDLWYRDQFRFYAEFIYADSLNHDLAPLAIDRNRGDFLNLFIDVKLGEIDNEPVYARVGRQELLFGSQRNITSLDWANTRRTFQGVRAFRTSEKFDVDLFWVQPVQPIAANFDRFDSVDNNVNFFGAWATYRKEKGRFFDLYYLFLDNTNRIRLQGIDIAPFNVHTLGTRWFGDKNGFLWDVELNGQFGRRGQSDIYAAASATGIGYNWANADLNPTVWLYYDYASGDQNPNAGDYHTYNPLFPFAHYYLGWIDQVNRQNIHDVNAHLFFYPTKWITVWTQYHHFWLASKRDALYNDGGVAFRRDPTGRAGSDVGSEFDLIVNFHLGKHTDILAGYSRLYGGDFLKGTSSATLASDSDFFYMQYNFRW